MVLYPINNNMNYDAFSHGQTLSKIWLCEQLESHIPKNTRAAILGSWYNVLAFMMLTRKSELYQYILGIDIDPLATDIAEYLVRKGVPFRETHHIAGIEFKSALNF